MKLASIKSLLLGLYPDSDIGASDLISLCTE